MHMPEHLERPGREGRLGRLAAFLCIAALALPWGARAEETGFYRGKTIRIVISTGVAGGYAEYARVLADHMGAHIAGAPSFIVQSMPGAGGLLAANYLYSQAPQDGTTMGIVHSSVPSLRSGATRACASIR
jgi:tripartite-type tricarboxylate transporter receptor subunit TctC